MQRLGLFAAAAAATAAMCALSAVPTAQAAVVRTNALGSGADAPLGNDSGFTSTTANGSTATQMEIRAGDASTSRNRLGIIRFDLSGISGDTSGASLTFVETGNNSRTVTVFGLLDGDAGESWDESTISYDTAPALSLLAGPPPATSFDPLRTVNLGTFGTTGSTNEALSFSGAALDSFLASDTNDLVTFYFYRDGGGSVTVRTKENTNNTPPTLDLPNAVVPEPAATVLLGLMGIGTLVHRRRHAR
jgi:hypothetical protein